MQPNPRNHASQLKRLALRLARPLALASALLSLPMAERHAGAQPSQPARARAECHIEETGGNRTTQRVNLTSSGQSIAAHYTFGSSAKKGQPKPAVRCSGPAKEVALEFYLLIDKGTRDGSGMSVEYSIDGKNHAQEVAARVSDFSVAEFKLPGNLQIAKPMVLNITIGEGEHEVLLLDPGFLRILKVEEQKPQAATPKPRDTTEEQKKAAKKPAGEARFSFGAESQMLQFGGLGGGARGTMADASLLGFMRINKHLSLVFSPRFNTYSISADIDEARNDIRMYSVELGAGATLGLGNHVLYALALPGWEWVSSSVNDTAANGRNRPVIGGEAGYGCSYLFGLAARGSTNPTYPLSLKAFASVPYGWVKGAYPKLDVDARWLRLFGNSRIENGYLVTPLDANDVFVRLGANVPLFRVRGVFMPSLLAGVELSKSGYAGSYVGASGSALLFGSYSLDASFTITVDRGHDRFMFLLKLAKAHRK